MSFPLQLGELKIATPAELADLVCHDARAGGGAVVAGQPASVWLLDHAGLEPQSLIGLAAAMLSIPDPAVIAEGARLAHALRETSLGQLLVRALHSHDPVLLFAADPLRPGSSVEDALLIAVFDTVDLADTDTREGVLGRLRATGRSDLELTVLLDHGSAADLADSLPGILVELDVMDDALRDRVDALAGEDGERGAAARSAMDSRITVTGGVGRH